MSSLIVETYEQLALEARESMLTEMNVKNLWQKIYLMMDSNKNLNIDHYTFYILNFPVRKSLCITYCERTWYANET